MLCIFNAGCCYADYHSAECCDAECHADCDSAIFVMLNVVDPFLILHILQIFFHRNLKTEYQTML